jgi:hypothetical protein
MMGLWVWGAASGTLIALGLVIWWTAWLAWPSALVLLVVGLLKGWKRAPHA